MSLLQKSFWKRKNDKFYYFSPLTLNPFPPKGGKGSCCSTVFSCPLWGKDVRRTEKGLPSKKRLLQKALIFTSMFV